METWTNLLGGLITALEPINLLVALAGCIMGNLAGMLPGLGPIAGIVILLPVTYSMDPTSAIIMLAAIYYGAMYGGTITTVLLNLPGEAASAITVMDGYALTRAGRPGAALAVAAVGSFIGGTVGVIFLAVAAERLAAVVLGFGPPEFFGLMVLAFALLTGLQGRNVPMRIMSGCIGLALALPGADIETGFPRLTFGSFDLYDGVAFVPVIMGLFGIGDILYNAHGQIKGILLAKLDKVAYTWQDIKASIMPSLRGSLIGSFLGLIPGVGTTAPTLMSYTVERKVSKDPERFGKGALEGVAGPESTNNAYVNAAYIPLFTLGVPPSPTVAILAGAFMMHGVTPGPFIFQDSADIVWPIIASLWVGNVILLVLNLPLVKMWVQVLKIPHTILFPLIIGLCLLGSYTVSRSSIDLIVLVGAGLLGYLFKLIDFPIAPIAMTLILGPFMEKSLRQSLAMSGGDPAIFFRTPLSTGLLIVSLLVMVGPSLYRFIREKASGGLNGGGGEPGLGAVQ